MHATHKKRTMMITTCLALMTSVACGTDTPTAPSADRLSIGAYPLGTGIYRVTTFTFTAAGAANGATYSWEFGDGTTASGSSPTATHVYQQNGVFNGRLQVTDPRGATVAASLPAVTINHVSGTWDLTLEPLPSYPYLYCTKFTVSLVQTENQIRGTIKPTVCSRTTSPGTSVNLVGSSAVVTGSVKEPRQVYFGHQSAYYTDRDDIYWTATLSSDLNTMTGTCTVGCSSMTAVRRN